MTRKQITIPGTERPDHPDIEAAALAYVDIRDQRMALKRTEAEKKSEMGFLMKQAKVKAYKFWDPRAERHRVARVEPGEETYIVELTDEGVPTVPGNAIATGDGKADVPKGLIEQAMADASTNVEIDGEGDVVVPDKAAPKAKRKAKKKS